MGNSKERGMSRVSGEALPGSRLSDGCTGRSGVGE